MQHEYDFIVIYVIIKYISNYKITVNLLS